MGSVLCDQVSAHLHGTVLRNVLRHVKTGDGGVIHRDLDGGVPGVLEGNINKCLVLITLCLLTWNERWTVELKAFSISISASLLPMPL